MLEKINNDLVQVLKDLQIEYTDEIIIEIPKSKDNGDYSSNISLKLSKILKKNPMEIASNICEKINKDNYTSVVASPPGFINFYVKKDYLLDNINNVLSLKENYGRSSIGKDIKYNVEYVSANPTGLLHVGTCRGAAYGDNICRILSFAGFDVTREYYFNDGGVQITNLGLSLKARYEEACGRSFSIPENGYHGHEIVDIATDLYKKHKDSLLNEPSEYFEKIAADALIEIIKKDLKDFGTSFDVWTSEQDIRDSGNIEKALELLKNSDNLYEEEGATFLKTTKYGDDKDRVVIKSDGNYTYLVPDIAYHLDKFARGFDQIVDVLGSDHHSYVTRLKASVEALGYDKEKVRIKLLQMVRLLRDGKEVKMSKRTGETITMRELIDDVGINSARYFFAVRSLDSQIDFDMDLAVKQSNENPVYYISYAYARICSILREKSVNFDRLNFETLNDAKAYNVLEKVYNFPKIVIDAAVKELPHLIANYVYDLASSFHSLYNEYRFICEDEKLTEENLKMILAIKITFENALNLIGIIPPERM